MLRKKQPSHIDVRLGNPHSSCSGLEGSKQTRVTSPKSMTRGDGLKTHHQWQCKITPAIIGNLKTKCKLNVKKNKYFSTTVCVSNMKIRAVSDLLI